MLQDYLKLDSKLKLIVLIDKPGAVESNGKSGIRNKTLLDHVMKERSSSSSWRFRKGETQYAVLVIGSE